MVGDIGIPTRDMNWSCRTSTTIVQSAASTKVGFNELPTVFVVCGLSNVVISTGSDHNYNHYSLNNCNELLNHYKLVITAPALGLKHAVLNSKVLERSVCENTKCTFHDCVVHKLTYFVLIIYFYCQNSSLKSTTTDQRIHQLFITLISSLLSSLELLLFPKYASLHLDKM